MTHFQTVFPSHLSLHSTGIESEEPEGLSSADDSIQDPLHTKQVLIIIHLIISWVMVSHLTSYLKTNWICFSLPIYRLILYCLLIIAQNSTEWKFNSINHSLNHWSIGIEKNKNPEFNTEFLYSGYILREKLIIGRGISHLKEVPLIPLILDPELCPMLCRSLPPSPTLTDKSDLNAISLISWTIYQINLDRIREIRFNHNGNKVKTINLLGDNQSLHNCTINLD